MGYDEKLAERVRRVLSAQRGVLEREMFGGLAFLLEGKMFVGIVQRELMVRVGPKSYPKALAKPHARPMDFTGKPMNGYVFVAARGVATARALSDWVTEGKEFVASLRKPAKNERHDDPGRSAKTALRDTRRGKTRTGKKTSAKPRAKKRSVTR